MSRGRWYFGLVVLVLGAALLAGCRTSGTGGSDVEATIQAAVEATLVARGEAPFPTQVAAPMGPPALQATQLPQGSTSAGEIRRVTAAELKAMVDAGQAIIVDARVKQSYDEKHIAGAISMPVNKVAERYTELPRDKHVTFYCT